MKNRAMRILMAGLFLCAAAPVLAQEKSGDEKKLDKASMELEQDAGKPEGNTTVTDKLMAEFKVDAARIQGLRDQKLGYGEVSIVLALAQGMPDGITDANVQKIMALRQGPPVMGWGKIAKEMGMKLGTVISKVKRVSAEARRHAKAEMMKKEGKMGRHEHHGRPGKMERPAGHPDTHGKH